MEDNKITIVDDDGKEMEMTILLTFTDDRTNKSYVVYYDAKNEDEETPLMASVYDDDGNLFPVEKEEEWDMIDEVVSAFLEDQDDVEA